MHNHFSLLDTLDMRAPLLAFSNRQERARVIGSSFAENPMPSRTKRSTRRRKGGPKKIKGAKGVRIVKGRLSLKVAGFAGTHKIAPSQLIRLFPLTKIKAVAKKFLTASGAGKKSKRKTSKKARKKRGRGRPRRRRITT